MIYMIRVSAAGSLCVAVPSQVHWLYKTGSTSEGQDQYIVLFICGELQMINFRKTCQSRCGRWIITTMIFGGQNGWLVWVAE